MLPRTTTLALYLAEFLSCSFEEQWIILSKVKGLHTKMHSVTPVWQCVCALLGRLSDTCGTHTTVQYPSSWLLLLL